MVIDDVIHQKVKLAEEDHKILFVYHEYEGNAEQLPSREMVKLFYMIPNAFDYGQCQCHVYHEFAVF